ncbi:3'-5' exonuclease [Streptomyces sp. TLI_053]|uniref:3'-5' exonuclease n=1 Tax=Streptomyces sp. TLI_053 TaxID=1855352 RepID=UPI000B899A45|nr:3'-5' exonuclease [Streptomyces sp. TLI_053]
MDLDLITEAFEARLDAAVYEAAEWSDVLEGLEAADAIVLLTAHRSKGLEYDTVFLLGLDENQWWAYSRDPIESQRAFFVGLSRAAERLIVTTTMPDARTGPIAGLFALLDHAGVPEITRS